MRSLVDWWLRRTIEFRISVVATTVTVLCLALLAKLSSFLLGNLLVDAADRELTGSLAAATAAVSAGYPMPTPPFDTSVRVLDRAGNPVDRRPRPPLDAAQIDGLDAGQGIIDESGNPPQRWLGTVVSTPDGSQRLVVVGASLVGYDEAGALAFQWLLFAAVVGGVVAGAATWVAVRSSLRPVRRMRTAAAALPPGERLPVPQARDELRGLAEALNALLTRRDEARQRLQRFTGDAAHELRSPVASIRAQAEVAVVHPDPDLAQEVLSDVVAESERLSTLIDDLLVLSRSDAGEWTSAGPVDLALAASAAVDRLPPDAPRVRLRVPPTACLVWAAPGEVELVLDNLLRNAARHARGMIGVLVLPTVDGVRLTVDDDGPGVPVEHRSRIFDRFYRVQDDRGRRTGGSGLGLALVAEVVRRRSGSVLVGESSDGGARFEVRWRGPPVRTAST
ncbi:MAG TPA: HAMP domain-containing sensor histidine kinase [Pseudonocardiaceae bacterium]|jgi:signal transduction histidine kinase|nr:HAMP domain-containing sensor histidine kinase [Pseudonocardiaceae bacterium]